MPFLHPDPQINAGILDFIKRSFRDVADQDYIAARTLYRHDLKIQFLWFCQQALEKYLKSILLFNGCDAKKYGHCLEKLYSDLPRRIPDIPFSFPKDVEKFIQYLDEVGTNRYFDRSYYTTGKELFTLDKTVWHFRLYARLLKGSFKFQGRTVDCLPPHLNTLRLITLKSSPHKFQIIGGYLEKVLASHRSDSQRNALVWKNFYYGKKAKRVLRSFTFNSGSANPAHVIHPNIFKELEKLVDFSKEVRQSFARTI